MSEDNEIHDVQEFEINFNNEVVLKHRGIYENINTDMVSEYPYVKTWTLNTDATLVSIIGAAQFNLYFYYNKDVYIFDYVPSMRDVKYSADISALSYWCQSCGWNIPSVADFLVKDNMDFWRHYWESRLVSSNYFEKHKKRGD